MGRTFQGALSCSSLHVDIQYGQGFTHHPRPLFHNSAEIHKIHISKFFPQIVRFQTPLHKNCVRFLTAVTGLFLLLAPSESSLDRNRTPLVAINHKSFFSQGNPQDRRPVPLFSVSISLRNPFIISLMRLSTIPCELLVKYIAFIADPLDNPSSCSELFHGIFAFRHGDASLQISDLKIFTIYTIINIRIPNSYQQGVGTTHCYTCNTMLLLQSLVSGKNKALVG